MYDRGGFPEEYAWAISPETMNIFRGAAASFMSDSMAGLVSRIVIGTVYAVVVGVSVFHATGDRSTGRPSLSWISRDQLFPLLVACHLLFAPYSGAYEDLLVLPVITAILLSGSAPKLASVKGLATVTALLIVLLQSYYPFEKDPLVFWIVKAGVLGYMVSLCRLPVAGRMRSLESQK